MLSCSRFDAFNLSYTSLLLPGTHSHLSRVKPAVRVKCFIQGHKHRNNECPNIERGDTCSNKRGLNLHNRQQKLQGTTLITIAPRPSLLVSNINLTLDQRPVFAGICLRPIVMSLADFSSHSFNPFSSDNSIYFIYISPTASCVKKSGLFIHLEVNANRTN